MSEKPLDYDRQSVSDYSLGRLLTECILSVVMLVGTGIVFYIASFHLTDEAVLRGIDMSGVPIVLRAGYSAFWVMAGPLGWYLVRSAWVAPKR